MQLLAAIILGAIAGWAANRIMGNSGSLLRNILIGILGSFVGTGIAGIFGIYSNWFGSLLLAIGGACLCIFVGRKLFSNELAKK